jgi:hypothetical protein
VRASRPMPPPALIKWKTVREYGERYSLRTLVETGTCRGDTIWFNLHNFKQIYSIELFPMLYERAREMFAPWKHVSILFGDSGAILPGLLAKMETPVLFWLDAHYSGGATARGEDYTPIITEMENIFRRRVSGDVILSDDARLFDGSDDYPKLDIFMRFIKERRPDAAIEVKNDIIRITGLVA